MEYNEIIEVTDGSNMTWNNIEIKNNTEYGYIINVVSENRIDVVILVNKKVNPTFIIGLHRNAREIIIDKCWKDHPKFVNFSETFRVILSLGESLSGKEKASIIYESI